MPIVTNPQGVKQSMTNDEARSIMGQKGWTINGVPSESANDSVLSGNINPSYPAFNSLLDSSGNIKQQYRLSALPDVTYNSNLNTLDARLASINPDKRALEAMRTESLRTGPSTFARLLEEQQKMQEAQSKDKASEANNAQTASSFSQLASRGGLSSGARERLSMAGQRNLSSSLQDIEREGRAARLGIATEDERNRLSLLPQVANAELNYLNPEFQKTQMWGTLAANEANKQADLGLANRAYSTEVDKTNKAAAVGENARLDNFNMGAYQEAMKAYAAEQQAKATAASGSGGKK